MMEAGIVAHLLADAGLSSLIGTNVFPLVIPEGLMQPSITYQLISGVPENTLAGPTGPVRARMQFNAFAISYALVKQVQDALRIALDGFGPALLPDGTPLDQATRLNTTDFYESDARLHRASSDYLLIYRQQ